MDVRARFDGAMGAALGPEFPRALGVAVSGGGDSMAMLHLAADWARRFGVALWPVTVDHGLREVRDEVALVAQACAELGLPHAVLRWDWDGRGNLQAAARQARLTLIDGWRGGVDAVLMGHTRDDQVETVAMRLARGAGVDGLGGMRAVRRVGPFGGRPSTGPGHPPGTARGPYRLVRPMLGIWRAELRHHLAVLRIPHAEDPSNDDPRFDRVRVRRALAALGPDAPDLSALSARMRDARDALAARARDVAAACVRDFGCDVAIDRDAFARVERDTQARLLSACLGHVAGRGDRPRATKLEPFLDRVLAGGGGTLHGALAIPEGATLWIGRELRDPGPATGHLGASGLSLLGEAATWRGARPPHPLRLAAPAAWREGELLECARATGGATGGALTDHPLLRAPLPSG
ncbi:MAG: tRNA lysidine(34) synthetase TilS [Paracoccaceae bacterium]